jgi:sec-independent protein translocase protein TatB
MNIGELLFLFLVALLVFGPKKLPEIARVLGKTMAELRRASNEFRHSLEEEIRNLEYQEQLKAEEAARAALPPASEPQASGSAEEQNHVGSDVQTPSETESTSVHAPADAISVDNPDAHTAAPDGTFPFTPQSNGAGASAMPSPEPWQTRERKW